MTATRSTARAGGLQAGDALDKPAATAATSGITEESKTMSNTDHAAALHRARAILNHRDADAAPALALELVASSMPADAAVAALEKATAPADLINTAKAMGLA